jgi:membrane-bound hydrogenase subunit mbhJ
MSELKTARRAAVWVTSLHTGGCSACAQSLAALDAPRYAQRLGALGVTLARVPRHSDIILLCGALTEQARASVAAVLEGAPRPRALVAVGDCAVNGCVFAGSPCLSIPLAQAFNVNIEIAGCPPAPQTIIEAIAEAQRLLIAQATTPTNAGEPVVVHVTPSRAMPETPAAPEAAVAPDHVTRLAALIEAARDGWDDDPGDDDIASDLTSDHLTGTSNGAPAPAARQPKEKRR